MKKCVIIPDSYKGTLSAIRVCDIMKKAVKNHFPDCEVCAIPIADGGEGTVDCFLYAMKGQKIEVETTGPYGEPVQAYYARIDDTAVIETASVAGLSMVEGRMAPRKTTTFGMGKLIRHAVENGCRKIIIGLGGSCTNDGGTGVARSLGTRFFDENGREFAPRADELVRISGIDNRKTRALLQGVRVVSMCDIDNPLYGRNGAAYVFAPQKGADEDCVKVLDENLRWLAKAIDRSLGVKVADMPGAGAAGGLGAGTVSFLGAELRSGIETVLELVRFDDLLEGADMVFTGEGQIDSQSLRGKAVIGVSRHAAGKKVPVTVVAGSIGEGAEGAYEQGVSAIFSINRSAMDFERSRYLSDSNLEKTMDSILRLYRTAMPKRE